MGKKRKSNKKGKTKQSSKSTKETSTKEKKVNESVSSSAKSMNDFDVLKISKELNSTEEKKLLEICACLKGKQINNRQEIDLWELRLLALSPGGLLHPEIRRLAWPTLLGIDISQKDRVIYSTVSKKQDLTQGERITIEQDVNRTVWMSAAGERRFEKIMVNAKKENKSIKKENLTFKSILDSTITNALIQCNTKLYYYQGYHDLTSILLLNLFSPALTSKILSQISTFYLFDFMQESFQCTVSVLQIGLWTLLQLIDEELLDHLLDTGLELHSFTLSWIIGWFSHDLKDITIASRVIDVCIASHPAMSIYLSAAMLSSPTNRTLILNSDCDAASIYSVIQQLPQQMLKQNDIDNQDIVEDWIDSALSLMDRISPQELMSVAIKYKDDESLEQALMQTSDISMLQPTFSPNHFSLVSHATAHSKDHINPSVSLQIHDKTMHQEAKESFIKTLNKKSTNMIKHQRLAIISAGKRKEYKSLIRKRRKHRNLKIAIIGSMVIFIISTGVKFIKYQDKWFIATFNNTKFSNFEVAASNVTVSTFDLDILTEKKIRMLMPESDLDEKKQSDQAEKKQLTDDENKNKNDPTLPKKGNQQKTSADHEITPVVEKVVTLEWNINKEINFQSTPKINEADILENKQNDRLQNSKLQNHVENLGNIEDDNYNAIEKSYQNENGISDEEKNFEAIIPSSSHPLHNKPQDQKSNGSSDEIKSLLVENLEEKIVSFHERNDIIQEDNDLKLDTIEEDDATTSIMLHNIQIILNDEKITTNDPVEIVLPSSSRPSNSELHDQNSSGSSDEIKSIPDENNQEECVSFNDEENDVIQEDNDLKLDMVEKEEDVSASITMNNIANSTTDDETGEKNITPIHEEVEVNQERRKTAGLSSFKIENPNSSRMRFMKMSDFVGDKIIHDNNSEKRNKKVWGVATDPIIEGLKVMLQNIKEELASEAEVVLL